MSSIETIPLSKEETDQLKKLYTPFRELGQTFVRTIPGNCVLPAAYKKFKDRYKTWQVRPDDVYVFAFPKNGTTWTEELVWCVQNDCDMVKAKEIPLGRRVPFLELPTLTYHMAEKNFANNSNQLSLLESMTSPRMFNSHLHFHLLPDDLLDKSKVVMCMRNPKDTVVSFFHHEKLLKLHGYEGDFPTYFNLFMNNQVVFGPYFEYIKEAWKRRDHPNLCLLFFEDMKKDQASSIRKVAKFLGKELDDEKVRILVEHLSFEKMKINSAVNKEEFSKTDIGSFMRKGQVGDWKNYFTADMNKQMDEAIEQQFKPLGLEFEYD